MTLATGISQEHCALVNLGYKDPDTVDPRDYEGDAKTLVIPRAGEMLYRVQADLKVGTTRARCVADRRMLARHTQCWPSGQPWEIDDYKIGVVGLGVMGANLARNIASKGFPVAGYDLDAAKTQAFAAGQSSGSGIGSADAPEKLMAVLERPRRVLMMVPAGAPVDSVIAHLRPHLEREDILIDGGNSFFRDTDRRADELASAGFRFVGMGVSGGEEGALRGPSMMPGGPREAWDALAPILRAMAAKAEDGEPCVSYMGPRGAGHYVKMVHNGIEYGDMQLIAEVYDVLTRAAGMSAREIADAFRRGTKESCGRTSWKSPRACSSASTAKRASRSSISSSTKRSRRALASG